MSQVPVDAELSPRRPLTPPVYPKKGAPSEKMRFLAGGVGGVAPVLVSLVVVDLESILLRVTFWAVVSYLIRVCALFTVGGLVGWFHKRENELFKVFQLGIAAPALIMAALNGNRVPLPQTPHRADGQTAWSALPSLVQSANAQTPPASALSLPLKSFSYPAESIPQQISRGLFGTVSKNVWYVVSGSFVDVKNAESLALKVRQQGFDADVYTPYGSSKYYAVIIGANLTQAAAQELRVRAIQAGLPSDTYLWTFPRG
jgi:hypothetical protein